MQLIARGDKMSKEITILSEIFGLSEEFQEDFQWVCEFTFRIPTLKWILEQQLPIHGHALVFDENQIMKCPFHENDSLLIHHLLCCLYSLEFAVGKPKEYRRKLGLIALFHDIGKMRYLYQFPKAIGWPGHGEIGAMTWLFVWEREKDEISKVFSRTDWYHMALVCVYHTSLHHRLTHDNGIINVGPEYASTILQNLHHNVKELLLDIIFGDELGRYPIHGKKIFD
jgi:hypothetical protein